ncbi:MAG: SIS domain-containing protein [Lachnospiraceae bacterium]|nr:SIS domain-containing protein [Lachnospiraceae bacterium]
MEKKIQTILDDLIMRHPELGTVKNNIAEAYEIIRSSYEKGGKLLVAGNGGSAADSEHIVGELMKGFVKKRPVPEDFRKALMAVNETEGEKLAEHLQGALPAVSLTCHEGLSTAYSNDVDGEYTFAQQLYGFGRPGDVFLAISTSGGSRNILAAAVVAKAMGIRVVGLSGKTGGKLKDLSDCAIVVPSSETFLIQELHLPVYHALCLMLEETFFPV